MGAGYSTEFVILNTGAEPLTGTLLLTGSDGKPLSLSVGSRGSGFEEVSPASSVPFTVAPAGTGVITASEPDSEEVRTGWAVLLYSEGSGEGVARIKRTEGGVVKSVVGIVPRLVQSIASFPVNDDAGLERSTGYAVANPGYAEVKIRITAVDLDGNTVKELNPIRLRPGEQTARFLWQDFGDPVLCFEGSILLRAEGSGTFAAMALSQDHGLLSAVPVITHASDDP
jgi:hypothetical protein